MYTGPEQRIVAPEFRQVVAEADLAAYVSYGSADVLEHAADSLQDLAKRNADIFATRKCAGGLQERFRKLQNIELEFLPLVHLFEDYQLSCGVATMLQHMSELTIGESSGAKGVHQNIVDTRDIWNPLFRNNRIQLLERIQQEVTRNFMGRDDSDSRSIGRLLGAMVLQRAEENGVSAENIPTLFIQVMKDLGLHTQNSLYKVPHSERLIVRYLLGGHVSQEG